MDYPYPDLEEVTKMASGVSSYERGKKQGRDSTRSRFYTEETAGAAAETTADKSKVEEKEKRRRRKENRTSSKTKKKSALPPQSPQSPPPLLPPRTLPRRLTREEERSSGGSAPSSPAVKSRKVTLERRDATLERQRRRAIKKRPRTAEVEAGHVAQGQQANTLPRYSRSQSSYGLAASPPGLPPKSPSPKTKRQQHHHQQQQQQQQQQQEGTEELGLAGALRQKVDLTNMKFAAEGRTFPQCDFLMHLSLRP